MKCEIMLKGIIIISYLYQALLFLNPKKANAIMKKPMPVIVGGNILPFMPR